MSWKAKENNMTDQTVVPTEKVVVEKSKPLTPPPTPSAPQKVTGGSATVEKIDKIIEDRAPELIRKLKEIRSSAGVTFQGMTKDLIRTKFSVPFTGDESYHDLRSKSATVSTLRQEASGYLKALEVERELAEIYITDIRDQLDQEIIMANLTAGRNDKISDKAREALTKRIYRVGHIGTILAEIAVEVTLWKSVLKDMDRAGDTIGQELQALASENKYAQGHF